jgi:hypothetical protein
MSFASRPQVNPDPEKTENFFQRGKFAAAKLPIRYRCADAWNSQSDSFKFITEIFGLSASACGCPGRGPKKFARTSVYPSSRKLASPECKRDDVSRIGNLIPSRMNQMGPGQNRRAGRMYLLTNAR